MLIKKSLIHLYYGENPDIKHIAGYYGNDFINKKDKLTLFVDRDGYPFGFRGVIFNICKMYNILPNLYLQNVVSSLISITYDKSSNSNQIFVVCNNTKVNPKLIRYDYYVELWNRNLFIKINEDGLQRDVFNWINISQNVLDYNILTKLNETIPPSVYSKGPCNKCLVVSACINKVDSEKYKVSKPCKELVEYCISERKKLMKVIPDDIKEFVITDKYNICWEEM